MDGARSARVLFVAGMFAFAVMYASFCATECAFEDLPQLEQHSVNQHDSSDHPQNSQHDGPEDSGCAASDHLAAFIPSCTGIPELPLGSVGHVNVAATALLSVDQSPVVSRSFRASDLAPPHRASSALYHQSSMLRI